MKLITNYKDYYDHVAHMYGGGDPLIPYKRIELKASKESKERLKKSMSYSVGGTFDEQVVHEPSKLLEFREQYQQATYVRGVLQPQESRFDFKFVNIMGRIYLMILNEPDVFGMFDDKTYTLWDKENPKHHDKKLDDLLGKRERYGWPWKDPLTDEDFLEGRYLINDNPMFLKLCQITGHPVMMINSHHRANKTSETPRIEAFNIDVEIPVLSKMGFASVLDPQQLYQDLSYFMGNTIRSSPDLAPPVQVSDKDRIVQHGFDLKQSFRHRKDES